MSIARGIAAALAGGLGGLAEAAKREDEKRDELSKVTLSQAMKNIEQAKTLAQKAQAEKKLEDETVEVLMAHQVNGQPVTRAQATAAYRQFGGDAAKLLLQNQIEFEGQGELNPVQPLKRGTVDIQAVGDLETRGLFADGRYESVANKTKALLQSMGYDPAGVDVQQRAKVSGVVIKAGKGLDKITSDSKYTNLPGIMGGMVTQVVREDTTGNRTTSYVDLTGQDVTEKISAGLKNPDYKIADSYEAIADDLNIREMGLAFRVKADGSVETLDFEVAYTKDGRRLRTGDSGKFDTAITDTNIVTLTSSQVAALGGANGVSESFDKLGKDGRKAFQEFNAQAESYEYLETVFQENLDLLAIHDDALVAPVGAVSEWVEFAKVNLGVAVEVTKDAAGELGIEFDGIDIGLFEREVDNLQAQHAEEQDPEKKLSIARKLYAANQVISAYYYAKSTGDTRISNQDFDQFLKTVGGGSAASQKAMYKSRLNQAKTALNSKFTTLNTYLPQGEDISQSDQLFKENITKAISTAKRLPAEIDARYETMFDADVRTATVETIVDEIEEATAQAEKYDILPAALINPNTGELTDSSDPDRVTAVVVINKDTGKIMTTPNGDPIYDTTGISADTMRNKLAVMIQNNLL